MTYGCIRIIANVLFRQCPSNAVVGLDCSGCESWVNKMIMINRLLSCIALVCFLSACATTGNDGGAKKVSYEDQLSSLDEQVGRMLETGAHDEAMAALKEFARHNPERKDPWLRAAKIDFERKNYAEAIVAAEEVLQRDASDRTAKSIRVVSGLRIATQSLEDLRDDIELKGGAKADAVTLAKAMRETLGEDVLVPEREKRRAAPRPAPRPKAANPPPPPAAGSGNPFGALK